ncbi:LuxR C-terminal-related transcriptional regulator [Aquibacillus sediminis]|uniref:LuxR C-terminal-related transcriptional regulator n=1 Tax=Aquibacillus sediminis TaxID=2574734 RepID=UPI001109FADE|nr:LuxR C-terminal-related transcriptional regulator [Aquibacillus sediminis]
MASLSEKRYQQIMTFMDELTNCSSNIREDVLLSFERVFGFERSNFWLCNQFHYFPNVVELNMENQAASDYLNNFYELDYFVPNKVIQKISNQRVLTVEDLISRKEYENSAFYNEFMRRYGYHHYISMYIYNGSELIGAIDFVRSKNEKDFTNEEIMCLEIISRHLAEKLSESQKLDSNDHDDHLTPLEPFTISPLKQSFKLTNKEAEVLQLVLQGCTNNDIAKNLFISINTVKKHLQSIYRKLEVTNRTSLSYKVHQLSSTPSVRPN